MAMSLAKQQSTESKAIHFPSLLAALTIMLVGTIYPQIFANPDGLANHQLAIAIFWAMSAGMVRGVGFMPRARIWRFVFSGWACLFALLAAIGLRWTL